MQITLLPTDETGRWFVSTGDHATSGDRTWVRYNVDGTVTVSLHGRSYRLSHVYVDSAREVSVWLAQQTKTGRDFKNGTGMWETLDTLTRQAPELAAAIRLALIDAQPNMRVTEVAPAAPTRDELVARANEIGGQMDEAMAAMDHERVQTLQAAYMEVFNQIDNPEYAPLPAAPAAAVVTTVPMCSAACPGDYLERTGGKHLPGCDQADAADDQEKCEICDAPAADGELVQNESAGRMFGSNPGPIVTCSPACSAVAHQEEQEDAFPRAAAAGLPTDRFPTAVEIADKVRAGLVGFGGRQGFLQDPGGWLDHVLDAYTDDLTDDKDAALHEVASAAIEMIEHDHEQAAPPETAEEMVTELHDEWGVVDAYVFDPGPGTVHIPTPDGSVFLSDREGSHPDPARPLGHFIGRRFDDGRDEVALWEDPQARSIAGALGKLAELATAVADSHGRPVTLTDLLDDTTATVALDQVAATIRGWYHPETIAAADNCAGCATARDAIAKADEFQAALLAADLVTAAVLAGEIGVAYDLNPA